MPRWPLNLVSTHPSLPVVVKNNSWFCSTHGWTQTRTRCPITATSMYNSCCINQTEVGHKCTTTGISTYIRIFLKYKNMVHVKDRWYWPETIWCVAGQQGLASNWSDPDVPCHRLEKMEYTVHKKMYPWIFQKFNSQVASLESSEYHHQVVVHE